MPAWSQMAYIDSWLFDNIHSIVMAEIILIRLGDMQLNRNFIEKVHYAVLS